MINRKMTYAGGLFAVALALGWAVETAEAANLDKGLLKEAGPILDALTEKSVKTVGVLPFRVKKGERQAGFDAAPLATGLPGRIENALIVSQGGSELKAMGIIRDATAAANKAKVGSWMTSKASFDRLFSTSYPLAWGSSSRKPDAFITGEVINSASDRYRTRVVVQLITAKSWKSGKPEPVKIHEFRVETDRALLRDLGYAYALPRSVTKKKGVTSRFLDQQAVQQVDKDEKGQKPKPETTQEKKQTSHTPDNIAGFRFEIEYNKAKQEITAKEGGSQAKQPDFRVNGAEVSQEVWMYLTRISSDEGKLGAVLKVNGRSVWEEQEGDPLGCKKWVYDLAARDKRWDFGGFYSKLDGMEKVKPFKVLTAEESEVKANELGSRAGWIDIDVFSSGGSSGGGGGGNQQEEELLITTRSATKARGKTLTEVQQKIAKANNLKLVKSKFTPRGGLIFMDSEPRSTDPIGTDELPNPKRVGGISIQYWEKESGKKID